MRLDQRSKAANASSSRVARIEAKEIANAAAMTGSTEATPKTAASRTGALLSIASGSSPPKKSAADDGQNASVSRAPSTNVPADPPAESRARSRANRPPPR